MTQCELKRGEARSHCTWTRGLSAGWLAQRGAEGGAGLRHQRLPSRDGAAARRGHQPLRGTARAQPLSAHDQWSGMVASGLCCDTRSKTVMLKVVLGVRRSA